MMTGCEKLTEQARQSAVGFRFDDLCRLAECHGFVFSRQKGSHRIYKRAGYSRLMIFQDYGGKAKPYQVKQPLLAIDELAGEQK